MPYGAGPRVLSIVLAGGEGKRLLPLTADRAKPAVPFGGHYRLIDFALSNLTNAGFRRVVVLTQYKSHSLDVHITRTWRLSTLLDNYVTTVPAQMRRGRKWFAGSADAIHQNLNLISDDRPDYVFVFGADHIYRMDPAQMLEAHLVSGAGVTVAGIRVPATEAHQFGVLQPAPGSTRIATFVEKPPDPQPLPDGSGEVLASMGNYLFTTEALLNALAADATDPLSSHDLGGNLIPRMVGAGEAHVYDFATNAVPGTEPGQTYWRDVGTLDSYHDAHMDLVDPWPEFSLYNDDWPVLTSYRTSAPAKLALHPDTGPPQVVNTILSAGVIVSGATVRNSVISPGAWIGPGAVVDGCVLLHDTHIGAGAVVNRSIIDKNVVVPDRRTIGVDLDRDREEFTVTESGITVIGKGQRVRDLPRPLTF